jgi:hypothetical protein
MEECRAETVALYRKNHVIISCSLDLSRCSVVVGNPEILKIFGVSVLSASVCK